MICITLVFCMVFLSFYSDRVTLTGLLALPSTNANRNSNKNNTLRTEWNTPTPAWYTKPAWLPTLVLRFVFSFFNGNSFNCTHAQYGYSGLYIYIYIYIYIYTYFLFSFIFPSFFLLKTSPLFVIVKYFYVCVCAFMF